MTYKLSIAARFFVFGFLACGLILAAGSARAQQEHLVDDVIHAIEDAEHVAVEAIEGAEHMAEEAVHHAGENLHEAAHSGHGEIDGLPQLDPTHWPAQIFWLAVFFVITYILLSSKVLPAIGGILEEREKRIGDDLDGAQSLRDEAEKVKLAYESAIAEAQNKARAALKEAQDEMNKDIAAREAEVNTAIAARLEDAEKRILAAKEKAMGDVKTIATEVVTAVGNSIAGIKITEDEAARAVGAATKQKEAA